MTNEGSNDVTVVDLAAGTTSTIAVGNAPRKVVVLSAAATTQSSGAKVSIANFAFAPGEITVAPGSTVTWTNDDGAPHGLAYNDGVKGNRRAVARGEFQSDVRQTGDIRLCVRGAPIHDWQGDRTRALSPSGVKR